MFVLRSHELDPGSSPRPDNGPVSATTDAGEPAEGRRQSLMPAGQGQRPRAAPKPGACASDPGPMRTDRERSAPMHMPLFAAAFAVRFGGATAAFECPKRIADVQALIDKISADVDRARDRVPWERVALVHALLDDARMLLEAARQNHEQPKGPYDHARAFAKADTALGHARAAEIVYSRCTQE